MFKALGGKNIGHLSGVHVNISYICMRIKRRATTIRYIYLSKIETLAIL